MSRTRSTTDLTQGPLFLRIILFTLPLVATGILQLLFNAADLAVVGSFSGTIATAAVGCCGSLINLIVQLFMGLSVGAGVIAAQDFGAKRFDEVKRLVSTSLIASLAGGVVVGVFGFIMAEPLLELIKTPGEVMGEAVPYMRAYFCGMPACLLYNYLAAILRSYGDTRRPLIFLSLAGVVNVVLNLIAVMGFGMGAVGVGIATAASQYVSALLIVLYMCRTDGPCRIEGLTFDWRKLGRMIVIGLPAGIQSTLFSLSNTLIQSTVNGYGSIVVAGNSAGSSLDGFIYIAQNAGYHAALTFVGHHVGAGKHERIRRITLLCCVEVLVLGIVMGVLMVGFGPELLKIYAADENRDAVIAAGMDRLRTLGLTYCLCGLMEVGCGVMRGMGKALLPMIVSLVGSCLFRILWISYVCPLDPTNIQLLYVSYPISWIVTAATHFVCCYFTYRALAKRRRLAEAAAR